MAKAAMGMMTWLLADRLAELQQIYDAKQTELDLLYRAYDRRAG